MEYFKNLVRRCILEEVHKVAAIVILCTLDQKYHHTLCFWASDLILHCLPMSHKKDPRHLWIKPNLLLIEVQRLLENNHMQ